MLEGFDSGWNEVGSDKRRVTYTNLDPGNYVFRVLGSNDDGVWNETGASIRVRVIPPWWESGWFRLGIDLLVAGTALHWLTECRLIDGAAESAGWKAP